MFVSPMLLHKFSPPFDELPFDENEYISELKIDGIRLLLAKWDNVIKLYTRHGNEITGKFPELLNIDIPNGTILDGEVVVPGPGGKPDFEETMSRFQAGRNGIQPIQYCVFDIIYLEDKRITHLPLLKRKELLKSLIKPSQYIAPVEWTTGNAEAYFNLTKEHGLEGIVIKKADSLYKIKNRSHNWLKVINYSFADVYITGLRKNEFGLLLSLEEGNKMRPVGLMEFMVPAARKKFYQEYRNYVVDENKDFIFLEPKIKAKVKYRNLTKENKLRIPSFVEFIS